MGIRPSLRRLLSCLLPFRYRTKPSKPHSERSNSIYERQQNLSDDVRLQYPYLKMPPNRICQLYVQAYSLDKPKISLKVFCDQKLDSSIISGEMATETRAELLDLSELVQLQDEEGQSYHCKFKISLRWNAVGKTRNWAEDFYVADEQQLPHGVDALLQKDIEPLVRTQNEPDEDDELLMLQMRKKTQEQIKEEMRNDAVADAESQNLMADRHEQLRRENAIPSNANSESNQPNETPTNSNLNSNPTSRS